MPKPRLRPSVVLGVALGVLAVPALWGVAVAVGMPSQEPPGESEPSEDPFEEEVVDPGDGDRGEGGPGEGSTGEIESEEGEVVEGDPESREPVWRLTTRLGNRASLEFPSGERSQPRVEIVSSPTGVAWHIRLGLGPFPVAANQPYMVHFKARSVSPRTFSIGLAQLRRPFGALTTVVDLETTPMWKTYQVRMVSNEKGDDLAGLMFNLGGNRHSVDIADVEVVRGSDRQVVARAPEGPARRAGEKEAAGGAGEGAGAEAATGVDGAAEVAGAGGERR